ncbi:hypothetical protein [Pseudomonas sp. NMI795_08]|uniref:hypothetical protein n=1 Tax=Pseudomonas sp. NMI795_08 TaxID=2903144 RepID=UPI001E494D1E|nr:hypothetical protein [Pseudomonas sp. NMI795_08]MCE1119129.1 hypothetical protein [Pseudomonas sp. NMI795_08]
MTIIKRADKPASADPAAAKVAAKAASSAPDSGKKMTMRGKRNMFNVGLEPALLDELDAYREQRGLSRPACIKIALRLLFDSAT